MTTKGKDKDGSDAPIDQDALDLAELAAGVLARDFRPRAASVRRLAEGVLTRDRALKEARTRLKKARAKRKLATIPGQKKKKKKDP